MWMKINNQLAVHKFELSGNNQELMELKFELRVGWN